MTKLYLVRHGQTIWNKEKRFQGWSDSPLSKLGERQAYWLGERLKEDKIDVIYSSSCGRAYTTATIAKGNRELVVERRDGLREINVGDWEGMYIKDIDKDYEEELYNFWNKPHLYKATGDGESFKDVQDRMVKEILEILIANEGKTILLVTHAVALKSFLAFLEETNLQQFWETKYVNQTSLTVINFEDNIKNGKSIKENFEIEMYADISHYRNDEMAIEIDSYYEIEK